MGRNRKGKGLLEARNEDRVEDMEWCECCEVELPNKTVVLNEHYNSRSHSRKEKLHLLHPFFQRQGLDYFPAATVFFCYVCGIQLPNDADELLYHLEKYANEHAERSNQKLSDDCLYDQGAFIKKSFVKKSTRLIDFEKNSAALDQQLLTYERIHSPLTLIENGPGQRLIFDLKSDVFTEEELKVLTGAASYLERNGNAVSRAEAKQSSRICLFGLRHGHGDTGWYVHANQECYSLSEGFARYVTNILRRSFKAVFRYLDSIPTHEGLRMEDASIGGGPFTSFSVSRDYTCTPHYDQDDYDLGFILWLREETMEDEVTVGSFFFPEVEKYFIPNHGDVICFRAKDFLHCTRRFNADNLLGLAFFQKCSLYRQLRKLLLPSSATNFISSNKKGLTKFMETTESFMKKREKYMEAVSRGPISMNDFMGV